MRILLFRDAYPTPKPLVPTMRDQHHHHQPNHTKIPIQNAPVSVKPFECIFGALLGCDTQIPRDKCAFSITRHIARPTAVDDVASECNVKCNVRSLSRNADFRLSCEMYAFCTWMLSSCRIYATIVRSLSNCHRRRELAKYIYIWRCTAYAFILVVKAMCLC